MMMVGAMRAQFLSPDFKVTLKQIDGIVQKCTHHTHGESALPLAVDLSKVIHLHQFIMFIFKAHTFRMRSTQSPRFVGPSAGM